MTANDYYTLGYIFASIVALCSISFFVDKLKAWQKKIVGIIVVICLVLGIKVNYAGKEIERLDSKVSETKSNERYDSIHGELKGANHSLEILSHDMIGIKTALNSRGLAWDSTQKKIYNLNSQINLPNATIKGGNNQFGNGNTQKN